MDTHQAPPILIDQAGLDGLIGALARAGYRVIGPTIRDAAIIYDTLHSTNDLPRGWTNVQGPGHHRLEQRDDQALFGYTVGPSTCKQFLFPPREKMWTLTIKGDRYEQHDTPAPEQPIAFLGVRACDLAAISIQDQVFIEQTYSDKGYTDRRRNAIIIAVNCVEAGATCFCTSMGTGPRVQRGYDLALTELLQDTRHVFLVEIGSARGQALLAGIPNQPASKQDLRRAEQGIASARSQMGKALQTEGLPELIGRNLEHPVWDEVANRCLACANCTMVCPTCFCHSLEDTSDLSGEIAQRWRQWDSCFNGDFSYVHGGRVRESTSSRYRQWMSHKLSTWHDQFGTSGCVGCGRCITWCPVGIDLTVEAKAIRDRDGERHE